MTDPQPAEEPLRMTQPLPVDQLRAAYAEWSDTRAASPDAFIALMSEEVTLGSVIDRYTGDPMAERFTSPEGARAYLSAITENWEMLEHDTEQTVAQGDTIVWIGHCRWRNRGSGAEVATPLIDVWRFDANGKAVSFYEIYDSLAFAQATRLLPP
jgi:uncharacterized protein